MGPRVALSHCKHNLPGSLSASTIPSDQNPTGTPFTPSIFNLFQALEQPFRNGRRQQRSLGSRTRRDDFQQHTNQYYGRWGSQRRSWQAEYFRVFAVLATTLQTSAIIPSKPPSISASLMRGPTVPPGIWIFQGLPVFTLSCTSGALTGQSFVVTDPGRALISGKCADIGKVKGPILGIGGTGSRLPQRIGRDPFRCGRILQPAFQSWFHGATEK